MKKTIYISSIIIIGLACYLFYRNIYKIDKEYSDDMGLVIACVNFNPIWGDKKANLEKMKENIIIAVNKGAQLIIFPELSLTGYDIDPLKEMHKKNAEKIPGFSTEVISEYSIKYGVYVVYGLPERDGKNPNLYYNSAGVVGPNGVIGSYRKMFPFKSELAWSSKGQRPFFFDTPWGIIGLGICYDTYMFPELARYYAALGARLYINITALTPIEDWKSYYLNQLRARAIENMMFIASANLTGKDLKTDFPGRSVVIGPGERSHIIKYYAGPADKDDEEIIIAKINLLNADNMRKRYPLFTEDKDTPREWRVDLFIEMLKTIQEKQNVENRFVR